MNVTVKVGKVDEKNRAICLVSMFPSRAVVLTLFKKVHFLHHFADLSKNLSLLMEFTYAHLKGFVTHFHKMVLFIKP